MKTIFILLVSSVTVGSLYGDVSQSAYMPNSWQFQDNHEKTTEVSPRTLPEKARNEIINTFQNGRITKVLKITSGNNTVGYIVQVEKDAEQWTYRFDKDGNVSEKFKH